jgi:hypothetical protein
MMKLTTTTVLFVLILPLVLAFDAPAQVLLDRSPVLLEYAIFLDQGADPIGTAVVSFEPKTTPQGKRLEVRAVEKYTLPASSPIQIEDDVLLICDGKGVESFDAKVKVGDTARRHEAVRKGVDYVVKSTMGTKTTEKTITAGVQVTMQGLYCGGFFPKNLRAGALFENFPLLLPSMADHRAGQLVREGAFPVAIRNSDGIPAFVLWLKRLDKNTDKFWLSDDRDQILLRKEQVTDRGTLVYEIVKKNGEPYPPPAPGAK